MNAKGYLAYNVNGYFQGAPQGQTEDTETLHIKDIYLWQKAQYGPFYDTFTVGGGSEISVTEGTVYDEINVKGLKNINAHKWVGGLVGMADTASVSSLVGDTAGIAKFEKFDFEDIHADRNETTGGFSTGLSVVATDYYAGGGIGMATGGSVVNVTINQMKRVQGLNCAGGFAGCVGPGALVATGGLDISLLGLSVIKANNLLSLGEGLETELNHVTVTGVSNGYTVEATGENAAGENRVFCAGGFFGRSNSIDANDCHAVNLAWVKAKATDLTEGRAGGFLGVSEVGGLASMDDSEGT